MSNSPTMLNELGQEPHSTGYKPVPHSAGSRPRERHELRVAVIGCGSIGSRHAAIASGLGVQSLTVCDEESNRAESVARRLGATWLHNWREIRAEKPDVVIIATPTQHHVDLAREFAAAGCHLFIEKPLSYRLDGVDDLCKEVEGRRLVAMVACNMRFHPGPATVHQWLADGAIGRVLSARVQTGSFLPWWRQQQPCMALANDSRQEIPALAGARRDSRTSGGMAGAREDSRTSGYMASYSAHPVWGGAILDCIHEIDLATWYLGPAELVAACWAPAGSIGLETDGLAELILRHESSAISSVHLNFVQRDYRRGCQIIGESGTIYWDESEGLVRRMGPDGELADERRDPVGWVLNDMYVDQLSHFLDCVCSGVETCHPIRSAAATLEIALAAREQGRGVA